MKPYNFQVPDLFDGDPDLFEEYHQDYREGYFSSFTHAVSFIPLLLCTIPAVYYTLCRLDYNLLPLPELLWNVLVYLTPSRILDAAEDYQSPMQFKSPALKGLRRTHAAKSEVMRCILGLDVPGGIIGSVAQAARRRASTLPGIGMSTLGSPEGRPAGLGNWDNSCYQNSVLQGLASLNSLSGYLTNPKLEESPIDGQEKPEMKMAEALRDLIATLNDPANNGRRIWTPATLKNMSSWQQQDAQEYFSKVLDEIDKEVGLVAKTIRTSQGFESDDSAAKSEIPALSALRNPLEGLLAQRVGCTKCGYSEGLSMIPFNCLTVPLGRAWEYDISECLAEYTKLEQIEGVECGKCTLLKNQRLLSTIIERTEAIPENPIYIQSKERLAAVEKALEDDDYEDKTLFNKCKIPSKSRVSSTKSRQAVIARPPRSLVVHLNRSMFDEMTGELKKNSSLVRFPKLLDLGPWCLGSSGKSDDTTTEEWHLNPEQPMIASKCRPSRVRGPTYELSAVVTHYGRHENGHYICYRKHNSKDIEQDPRESWWRLSDDDVIKVTEDNVLSQGGVFMLFYDCIKPATPAPLITTEVESEETMAKEQGSADSSAPLYVSKYIVPDLDHVASIPLPDIDDEDLFSENDTQESIFTLREGSVATDTAASVSEFDDEEDEQDQQQEYQPVKAIVISQVGVHKEGDGNGQQRIPSPGSLVMV